MCKGFSQFNESNSFRKIEIQEENGMMESFDSVETSVSNQ
jgi:hypothetical protein